MTVIDNAFISITFKISNNANNSKARPGLIKVKDDLSDRSHRDNRPKSWRVEVRVSAVGCRRERVVHLARSCHALSGPWMSLSYFWRSLSYLSRSLSASLYMIRWHLVPNSCRVVLCWREIRGDVDCEAKALDLVSVLGLCFFFHHLHFYKCHKKSGVMKTFSTCHTSSCLPPSFSPNFRLSSAE